MGTQAEGSVQGSQLTEQGHLSCSQGLMGDLHRPQRSSRQRSVRGPGSRKTYTFRALEEWAELTRKGRVREWGGRQEAGTEGALPG